MVQKANIEAVTALGRIEPQGEVIQLAPSPNLGGSKVDKLFVKEGDTVTKGQVIAILDNNAITKAQLERANSEVKVQQANLDIVKAGAKQGEIEAQKATIRRLQAQLDGEIATNDAKIARLQAQLNSETVEKKATIQRVLSELNNGEIEWKRYQNLAADGAISQSVLDEKRLTFDTAKQRYAEAQASYQKTVSTLTQQIRETKAIATQSVNTLEQQIEEARANLDRIAEVREVDVLQAEAKVVQAIAALKETETQLDLTYIKAPMDGQIIDIKAYPGENIDLTQGIVELGNTEKMMVVAEVYESDISKVELNQEVTIISENGAFDRDIKGKVIDIGRQIGKKDVLDTDPASDVDARVVEVKIAVNPEDSSLISNLTYSKVLVKISL